MLTDDTLDHGPSWRREADPGILDPAYGTVLKDHGVLHDPHSLDTVNPEVEALIADKDNLYGKDPTTGERLDKDDYEERFVDPKTNREIYPGNDGAVPGTFITCTDIQVAKEAFGADVDRIGSPYGEYLSFYTDGRPASFEERSLGLGSLEKEYNKYTLSDSPLPLGWKMEISVVAPGLGRPGGATQLRFFNEDGKIQSINALLMAGVLV